MNSHEPSWIDVLEPFRQGALLCGAGISVASGAPTGQQLNELVLSYAPDQHAEDVLRRLLSPPSHESVFLRFEGILEVLQRYVDSDLHLLSLYHDLRPSAEHFALATIAHEQPVLTTNFDALIEAAGIELNIELQVRYLETDFSKGSGPGLWKLHGTLRHVEDGKLVALGIDNPGSPVVTLATVSSTRESDAKRNFVFEVRRKYSLVVIGYSGSDDFDVGRWIGDAQSLAASWPILWVQYVQEGGPRIVRGAAHVLAAGLDRGVTRLAHLALRGRRPELLTVLTHPQPVQVLQALAGANGVIDTGPAARRRWESADARPWQAAIVTAALFAQVGLYHDAIRYFRDAEAQASEPREQLLALLELAEVESLVGDPALRHRASDHADAALCLAREYRLDTLGLRAAYVKAAIERLLAPGKKNEVRGQLLGLWAQCDTRAKSSEESRELHPIQADIAVLVRQIDRHLFNEGSESKDLARFLQPYGSLRSKALDLHENARTNWEEACTVEHLKSAAGSMRDAVELRLDLCDIKNACASLNVLGVMYQRAVDLQWLEGHDVRYERSLAKDAHWCSKRLAARHGLPWDELQATIQLVLLYVRHERNGEAALILLGDLERLSYAKDRLDHLRTDFALAFLPFLDRDDSDAWLDAAHRFAEVASYRASDERRGGAEVAAALLNAAACLAWIDSARPTPSQALLARDGLKGEYWQRRIDKLLSVDGSDKDSWRWLLDPIGGPVPRQPRSDVRVV